MPLFVHVMTAASAAYPACVIRNVYVSQTEEVPSTTGSPDEATV